MKIRPEDYEKLRAATARLDTAENRAAYRAGRFPRSELTKDVNKRYRWDLLYGSGLDLREMYSYLSDEHIDTALRRIVPPL